MSEISNLIFAGAEHKITSSFGKRAVIGTSAGETASFHNGTDYGTDGKKTAQYAIENGYVFAAQKAEDGANYVWVIYPRIKKAMLHYHLDSYKVKAKQSVKKGTLLGYTGMTGKATGVHLHLGIRELNKLSNSKIKNMTWEMLRSCAYIDPEKVNYTAESTTEPSETNTFLPSRGYITKGDSSDNIGRISSFMYNNFPLYTPKSALGNYYGDNIIKAIKEFQKRTGLESDGNIGPITLNELEKYGFQI